MPFDAIPHRPFLVRWQPEDGRQAATMEMT